VGRLVFSIKIRFETCSQAGKRLAEVLTVLIRNRPIFIYDNTIRSTEFARGFNLMYCFPELPMMNP
jgi:hypothetical protein